MANLYGRIVRTGVPTTFVGTTGITKVAGRAIPASVVGTMVIVSVVPTRLVGTAVPASVVETMVIASVVPTRLVEIAVPASVVGTAVQASVVSRCNIIFSPCKHPLANVCNAKWIFESKEGMECWRLTLDKSTGCSNSAGHSVSLINCLSLSLNLTFWSI